MIRPRAVPGYDRRDLGQRIQYAGAGFAMHLGNCVIAGSAASAASIRPGQQEPVYRAPRRLLRGSLGSQHSHNALTVGAVVGNQYLAVPGDEGANRGFNSKCPAALQWDADMVRLAFTIATRSRQTVAVSSLNALSHDPQSTSIAALVSADVVSGPGVSNIGLFILCTLPERLPGLQHCR